MDTTFGDTGIQRTTRYRIIDVSSNKPLKSAVPSQKELTSKLDHCRTTGDVREAIKIVLSAEEFALTTPDLYRRLLDLLRNAPFDAEYSSVVASWFYSKNSPLPPEVLKDRNFWLEMLKVAFHFGNTHRTEDLRALLEQFKRVFRFRIYGIKRLGSYLLEDGQY
ncbi:unnamed protein product [Rhizopus microsporus]